jgi:DNA (cytosine-5)-methyltransferase 1
MFPQAVRCVRETRPKAFIFENVRGLVRPAFFNYFNYICLQLEYPPVVRKLSDNWQDHHRRLQQLKTSGIGAELSYNIVRKVLNAADYGVPQRRERVFIVGFRSDLGVEWSFPDPTHTEDGLLYEQFISGDYWEQHKVAKRARRKITPPIRSKLRKIDPTVRMIPWGRWQTVRDALAGLPDPQLRGVPVPNHRFQDGAKSYPGHTGSPIDEPGKTLKAGDHGVPGGENTVRFPDGSVRYFTVREAARLQTFPDNFVFHGSWTETMRQLGNAVPVALGRSVAESVAASLTVW